MLHIHITYKRICITLYNRYYRCVPYTRLRIIYAGKRNVLKFTAHQVKKTCISKTSFITVAVAILPTVSYYFYYYYNHCVYITFSAQMFQFNDFGCLCEACRSRTAQRHDGFTGRENGARLAF